MLRWPNRSPAGPGGPTLAAVLTLLLALMPAGPAAPSGPCADQTPWGPPRPDGPADAAVQRVCKQRADGVGFYLLGYDHRRAAPRWAAYHLSRSKMLAVAALDLDRPGYFAVDRAVDSGGRDTPRDDDYTGVGARGLARGHLAPSKALSWDPAAQAASWRVSNVAVQDAGLNSGAWARLEGNVRAWACRFGTVYVVTGTIHRPGGLPPLAWAEGSGIDVPDAFYKVVYTPREGGRAVGVLLPNRDLPATPAALRRQIQAIDRIERRAGLDLLPELPEARARALEATPADPEHWPLKAGSGFTCEREDLAARIE